MKDVASVDDYKKLVEGYQKNGVLDSDILDKY